MLPFCEWGCNIFSRVSCLDIRHPVHTFEDFAVQPQNSNLDTFFDLWMGGSDILPYEPLEAERVEITNPFTGEKKQPSIAEGLS